jgi:hypothetical protein
MVGTANRRQLVIDPFLGSAKDIVLSLCLSLETIKKAVYTLLTRETSGGNGIGIAAHSA